MWAKPLPAGSNGTKVAVAVLIINNDDQDHNATISLQHDLNMSTSDTGEDDTGEVRVRDVWRHQDLGAVRMGNFFTGRINARDSRFYTFSVR